VAAGMPVGDEALCVECNECALVCAHAAIRVKVYPPEARADAPATFKHGPFKGTDLRGDYTVQVAPEDCTGCALCVMMCPVKDKINPAHRAIDMAPQPPLRRAERENYAFFLSLPQVDRARV